MARLVAVLAERRDRHGPGAAGRSPQQLGHASPAPRASTSTSAPGDQAAEALDVVGHVEVEHDAALGGVVGATTTGALGAGLVVEERARSCGWRGPPGGSTTITSAPRSASSLPAKRACSWASSTTVRPSSGPIR